MDSSQATDASALEALTTLNITLSADAPQVWAIGKEQMAKVAIGLLRSYLTHTEHFEFPETVVFTHRSARAVVELRRRDGTTYAAAERRLYAHGQITLRALGEAEFLGLQTNRH